MNGILLHEFFFVGLKLFYLRASEKRRESSLILLLEDRHEPGAKRYIIAIF